MWPYNMTYQQMKEFLMENCEEFIDNMMEAYAYTVDEIVLNHMVDNLEEFAQNAYQWEAC
jgi:hypothetical protein